jgi:uncharacterized protein (DUF58 family)
VKALKIIFSGLYIHPRFYTFGCGVIMLFIVSFFIPVLFLVSQICLALLLIFLIFDVFLLFRVQEGILAQRILHDKMSNGDLNEVKIILQSKYDFPIISEVIDEIPVEFQVRNFYIKKEWPAGKKDTLSYQLRPVFRGLVSFGKIIVYATSPLKMAKRRFDFDQDVAVPVYPSFMQMKKYELIAFSNKTMHHGLKKVRRIGHTMEFEKIKEYVSGDDFRTVNWKATAKTNKLMVNQYQDERSQSVYCIIDKGRVMKMPFHELTLLDYAINASLVITNVILRKQDFAGFFSFSRKVDNRVLPDRKASQMQKIMDALYNVSTDYFESDYGRLYADIKKNIPHRSLLLLFTNFETLDGLQRQLPYLKAISKNHLLIVIFFQNTEMDDLIKTDATDHQAIIDKVIAEKFAFEKKLIANELKKYGIQCILTKPENLTIDSLNKYLEVKARGMI